MNIPDNITHVYESSNCIYTKEQVDAALDKMAKEIHEELEDKNPLFLCVMVGGLIPAGHLLTRMDFPLEVDYVHATRYQSGTVGKEVTWKNKPSTPIKGRIVLVLDDILDGGITLQEIVNYCKDEGAAKVYTAVLVDKHEKRLENGLAKADFTGLLIDDYYIFGYGMDYKEYLRNAPGIYAVADEHL